MAAQSIAEETLQQYAAATAARTVAYTDAMNIQTAAALDKKTFRTAAEAARTAAANARTAHDAARTAAAAATGDELTTLTEAADTAESLLTEAELILTQAEKTLREAGNCEKANTAFSSYVA